MRGSGRGRAAGFWVKKKLNVTVKIHLFDISIVHSHYSSHLRGKVHLCVAIEWVHSSNYLPSIEVTWL